MTRRFPSATLAELRTDPRTFPTIIFPSVEADILNALMAEFSSSDRAEDELILFFEEKLYDGHVSNFFAKDPYYIETCDKFVRWARQNRDELSTRWPKIMELSSIYCDDED